MKNIKVLSRFCLGLFVGFAAYLSWRALQVRFFSVLDDSQSAPSVSIGMKFHQLKKGMAQEEVIKIMGYPIVASEMSGKLDMFYGDEDVAPGNHPEATIYIVTLTNGVVWNLIEPYEKNH